MRLCIKEKLYNKEFGAELKVCFPIVQTSSPTNLALQMSCLSNVNL